MTTFDNFDFSFDVDVMQQDLTRVERKPGERSQKNSDKYVVFPKGEGSLIVRILPANTPKGAKLPYACTRLHYINGRGYHCLRELEDEKWRGECPICSYYSFLYKMADEAKTKDDNDAIVALARKIKPIERYYYNVIVREEYDSETKKTKTDVGPKILGVGKTLHGRILQAFIGNKKFRKKAIGNIAHPLTGRDLNIVKSTAIGHDGNEYPSYDQSEWEDETVLGDDKQIKKWLGALYDLEAERRENINTADELQHQVDIYMGKTDDEALDFNPAELELPSSLKLSTDVGTKTTAPDPETVMEERSTPSPVVETTEKVDTDLPFDIDLDDLPDIGGDWADDLQKKGGN